jgi:hypothetical protein
MIAKDELLNAIYQQLLRSCPVNDHNQDSNYCCRENLVEEITALMHNYGWKPND